ncbi:MAG: class I SAM-dependent methyltransferase, partial [Rhodospirillales bacterium]
MDAGGLAMTGAMPADLPALFKDFGLDYHFEHLSLAIEMFGPLKGKRVLEIGGCLPREIVIDRLEAGEWIGTDLPGYWDESGDDNPSRRIGMNRKPLQGFNPGAVDHVCLEGDVLELDSSLDGRFDLVFSVSAFEHIADIPATLSVASRALKEGGGLFATALPIWPSEKGHHLPPISDGGKEVSFSMLQVPPWPHLTLRPNELS